VGEGDFRAREESVTLEEKLRSAGLLPRGAREPMTLEEAARFIKAGVANEGPGGGPDGRASRKPRNAAESGT
jgi:hypothetical protein